MFTNALIVAFAILFAAIGPDRLFRAIERAVVIFQELREHSDDIRSQALREHLHKPIYPGDSESPVEPLSYFVIALVFFAVVIFFLQDSGIFTAAWLMPFGL